MCEHFRFHIALHELRAKDSQRWNREWNVKLHVKRSRRENHRANRRRVIVDPSRDSDGGETVREHNHVFPWNAMFLRNVAREAIHILDHVQKAVCRTALAGRMAVTARVPSKDRNVIEA